VSEDVQLDAQILLWIFANPLQQVGSIHEHLVRIVVERIVLEEFPGGALSRFQLSRQLRKFGEGGIELLG